MKIAVYTTIFGGYAPLRILPPQSVEADFFCITDDPTNLATSSDHSDPKKSVKWNVIEANIPRRDLAARLRAKFFKMFPTEIEQMKNYDVHIYIDGSIEVTSTKFVEYCINNLKSADICLFKHPDRDCIFQEANASIDLIKYKNENINQQMSDYHKFFPTGAGLYACGILVRRNNSTIKSLMGNWWWEQIKYTYQDQLSFPVVCKMKGIMPNTFPDPQYKNNYFRVHWHDDKPADNAGKQPYQSGTTATKHQNIPPVTAPERKPPVKKTFKPIKKTKPKRK